MPDRRISDAELIRELHRIADEYMSPPTVEQMQERGVYSYETYRVRFGGWNEALSQAGLQPNQPISDVELLGALREFTAELGRVPTQADMDENGPYSVWSYKDRFGSWLQARAEAGLPEQILQTNERVSDWELLQDVKRVIEEIGHPPSREEFDRFGEFDDSTVVKRFGGLHTALRIIGFKPTSSSRPIPALPLLIELRSLSDILGRPPRVEELKEHGAFSERPYERVFGGFSKALREAGLDPNHRPRGEGIVETECTECGASVTRARAQIQPTGNVFCSRECYYAFKSRHYSGEKHWAWKGNDVGYGPNWHETRQKVRQHDEYRCQQCGRTEQEQRTEFDAGLSVHHIQPRSEFNDLTKADKLENLVALCTHCHLDIERKRRSWD